jgi:hypothetical protein
VIVYDANLYFLVLELAVTWLPTKSTGTKKTVQHGRIEFQ